MQPDDRAIEQTWQRFHSLINMSSPALRAWLLAIPGDAFAPAEGVDLEALGNRVLDLLGRRMSDLTAGDVDTMEQVAGLVEGLLASPPPAEGPSHRDGRDAWRHTLMTLGHDPLAPDSDEA
jgi:Protein of unknown function (DUF3140)